MSEQISRRKLIATGLVATAGVVGLGVAASIAQKYGLIPPDHGGIYGLGETLNYASQRLLTKHSLAREFARRQISKIPFANEIAPLSDEFKRLQAGGFADWRLSVDGMVAHPASFSLAQLKSYPSRSQITQWRAKRDGRTLPSGLAYLSLTSLKSWESCRKPDTWSTSRSNRTGGIASIWPMHCIRRRFSPMA